MSGLSHANNWTAALELFTSVHEDPQVLEQPKLLESGLIALSTALHKAGASVGLLIVLHFMLEHCIKVKNIYIFTTSYRQRSVKKLVKVVICPTSYFKLGHFKNCLGQTIFLNKLY